MSCVLDMSRRAWPELQSYTLVELAKRSGIDTAGHHRVLTACQLTIPSLGFQ
jgi:DNA polymerase III epsilon subunit-like protein